MAAANSRTGGKKAPLSAPLSKKLGPALQVIGWVRAISAQDLATALSVHPVTARRYLRQLHDLKLTRRQPFSYADHGGTGWLHSLSPKGARAASDLLGYHVSATRTRTLQSPLINHQLDTTGALCGLIGALSSDLVAVHTGKPLHSLFQAPMKSPRYQPDAYLSFRVIHGTTGFLRHAFIEVDRATEAAAVLEDKLMALHRYYAIGAYQKDFKSERLVVLFTVPGEARIPAIVNAVQASSPCVRVLVKAHDSCVSSTTALEGWLDCRSSTKRNLLDPAPVTKEENQ